MNDFLNTGNSLANGILLDIRYEVDQERADHVTRHFNASSAGLKKPVGLILRWKAALRYSAALSRTLETSRNEDGSGSPRGTELQLTMIKATETTKNLKQES